MPSHKSSPKKERTVQAPQRANGKLRVAAILEAAGAVFAERGYEGATMAEIAARSGTKIGSLYRFFPDKKSLADTIVASARENFDAVFDKFDEGANALPVRALVDDLLAMIFDQVFTNLALMKLLDAGRDWSVKREELRNAVLRRIARTLTIHSPNLPKKSAEDIALAVLLNAKAMATHPELSGSALEEFREMTRLYLQGRLGSFASASPLTDARRRGGAGPKCP